MIVPIFCPSSSPGLKNMLAPQYLAQFPKRLQHHLLAVRHLVTTQLVLVIFTRNFQWIGLRENLQETMGFTIKYRGFL